jgi:hypothetical protein
MSLPFETNWIGLLFVATLGALATIGLKTGSLAPLFPALTRSDTPVKFWLAVVGCILVVTVNVARLFLQLS